MRITIIGAAFAAFCGFASAAGAETAGAEAVRAWLATIDASPQWSAKFASLEDAAGRVTVTDLVIKSETGTEAEITFDRLAVRGYAAGAKGGFSAREIRVGNLAFAAGPLRYRIQGFVLKGLGVPAFNVGLDPEHLFTSIAKAYTAFSTVRLASARIERIDLDQTVDGVTQQVSYGSMWLSGFRNGRLDAISMNEVAGTTKDDGATMQFRIGATEIAGVDFAAFARFLDPDAYKDGVGDETWRQAMKIVSYGDISIGTDTSKTTIDRLVMRDFRVRQPRKSFAPYFDELFANPDMDEDAVGDLMAEHGLDFFSGLSIGEVAVTGIDGAGEKNQKVTLKEFAIRDISLASIGEIGFRGADIATEESGKIRVDAFKLGNIVMPSVEVIRAAIAAEKAGETPDPMTLIPQLGFLDLLGVAALPPEQTLEGTLKRLRIDLANYISGVPMSGAADVNALELPVAVLPDDDTRTMLEALGYTTLGIDFGYRFDWKEDGGIFTVRDLRLGLRDIGEASMDLTLGGLTPEMIADRENVEALALLTFEDARITVTDRSITDKLLAFYAAKKSAKPEDFRKALADGLPLILLALNSGDSDLAARAAKAASTFISNPGTLTVTIKPKQPIPMMALAMAMKESPADLPNLVTIEFENGP